VWFLSSTVVTCDHDLQWTLAALVYSTTNECRYLTDAIKDVFDGCGITIATELSVDSEPLDDATTEDWLYNIQSSARSKHKHKSDEMT